MPNIQSFNAQRARSYILRLPLFTRAMIVVMTVLAFVGVFWNPQDPWNIREWWALIPLELNLTTVHKSLLHAFFNILALTPLLERFETEFGTLTSLALFFGPLTAIPGLAYVLLERVAFGGNNAVLGASIWVFLLLGMEGVRTFKTNPYLVIGTYHVPTWTTPLFMTVFVQAIVPGTSFLGHLCGVGTGYLCTHKHPLLYVADMNALTKKKLLSWLGVLEETGPAGMDSTGGGEPAESAGSATALRQRGSEDIWPIWGVTHERFHQQQHDADEHNREHTATRPVAKRERGVARAGGACV
ncbi:hypothetical protein EKO27_g10876 [Xylaria grammica]|uniref:rhomboid protease n=1 Tax=Xylaria grammica TaxID=363999 RepID=A0A439CPZ6_9PEZI|nr:hypothetical protein EKO27_g10876 [Xylaria grammica]